MYLVNDHHTQATTIQNCVNRRFEQQLRSEVDDRYRTIGNLAIPLQALLVRDIGIKGDNVFDPTSLKSSDLIVHKRFKRLNHERQKVVLQGKIQGGQLEQQRFTRTGRRRHKDIREAIVSPLSSLSLLDGKRRNFALRDDLHLLAPRGVLINF